MPRYNHSHRSHHDQRLSRRSKTILHITLAAVVALDLMTYGARLADWCFVVLAIAIEIGW